MPTTTLYACLQFAIIRGTHPYTWRNNSGSVGIARNWKMAKKWPKLGKDCIFWAPTTLYYNAIMSILSPLSNHYVQTMCQEVQFWIKCRCTVQDSQWSLEIPKTHSKQRFWKFFWLPPTTGFEASFQSFLIRRTHPHLSLFVGVITRALQNKMTMWRHFVFQAEFLFRFLDLKRNGLWRFSVTFILL